MSAPEPAWTVAGDAAGDPTLWHGGTAVLRPTDIGCPSEYRDRLWALLTSVLVADDATIEQLAEAMHDRLRWASMHWSTQHWAGVLAAGILAAFGLWGWLARTRFSHVGTLPQPIHVGQADPRVADLEHMSDDEIARFIADCAEAAAVIERQWSAAHAVLAERHRNLRLTEDT